MFRNVVPNDFCAPPRRTRSRTRLLDVRARASSTYAHASSTYTHLLDLQTPPRPTYTHLLDLRTPPRPTCRPPSSTYAHLLKIRTPPRHTYAHASSTSILPLGSLAAKKNHRPPHPRTLTPAPFYFALLARPARLSLLKLYYHIPCLCDNPSLCFCSSCCNELRQLREAASGIPSARHREGVAVSLCTGST